MDSADGAAVRIAMTVGTAGEHSGELLALTSEETQADGSAEVSFDIFRGKISSELSLGADISGTRPLTANAALTSRGVMLFGDGFIVTKEEAIKIGLGKIPGLERHIREYRNGKDLTEKPRGFMVIDLFGLTEEQVRKTFPSLYQHILTTVKPERDANRDDSIRRTWWIFGRPRSELRPALAGLSRYIGTVETAKHRWFEFLDNKILADNRIVVFALHDAFHLGVLSSRPHVTYTLASGGVLEDRPVYNKTRCFDPFPFPAANDDQKEKIRNIAEELDAHRKRGQLRHDLALTSIYNVLEKLRAGEELNAKEKSIHDKGLVSVLKQLHDDLDAAVFAAYGWPSNLTDAEILERLVALNAERAAEEKRGIIHWLRPDYQLKALGKSDDQTSLALPDNKSSIVNHQSSIKRKSRTGKSEASAKTALQKLAWPKTLAARVQAIEAALHSANAPITPADLTKQFARAKPSEVQEILETLATLGRAHRKGEKYTR